MKKKDQKLFPNRLVLALISCWWWRRRQCCWRRQQRRWRQLVRVKTLDRLTMRKKQSNIIFKLFNFDLENPENIRTEIFFFLQKDELFFCRVRTFLTRGLSVGGDQSCLWDEFFKGSKHFAPEPHSRKKTKCRLGVDTLWYKRRLKPH